MGTTTWPDLFVQILDKLPITLFITVLSLLFAMILGLVLAVIRIKKVPALSQIVKLYVSFVRSTPLILQLFLVYFALPIILQWVYIDINHFSRLFFVILTFTLHTGSYLSEVMRAGYNSVDKGQIEAGKTVGLNDRTILLRIIIPQGFRNSLPNIGNQVIELIKDTSLAFTIGLIDMMGQVNLIIGNNYGLGMFPVYVAICIIYWVICIIVEFIVMLLEKKYNIPYQTEQMR